MSVDSNINSYYEELVSSIADRAEDYKKDGGVWDGSDEVYQAIDDEMIYYCDQGYVLAMAICKGYISWYKNVQWDEVYEMLYSDVQDELEYRAEHNEKKGEER